MITGRRASDWLRDTAKSQASEGERRGGDRRAEDHRAPRRRIDPLFAATLLNHIEPASAEPVRAYAAPRTAVRAGIALDRWARAMTIRLARCIDFAVVLALGLWCL